MADLPCGCHCCWRAEWAQKVPVKQGGVMVKPEWDGPKDELPKEARNDFQVKGHARS